MKNFINKFLYVITWILANVFDATFFIVSLIFTLPVMFVMYANDKFNIKTWWTSIVMGSSESFEECANDYYKTDANDSIDYYEDYLKEDDE